MKIIMKFKDGEKELKCEPCNDKQDSKQNDKIFTFVKGKVINITKGIK